MQHDNDDPNIHSEQQSFLKLTRDIAALPLEQSAAALETGAAIASISLRAAIEFLRAVTEVSQILEASELREWGEVGPSPGNERCRDGDYFFQRGCH